MSTRKPSSRPSRRSSGGKLALKIGLVTGVTAFVVTAMVGAFVVGKLGGHVVGEESKNAVSQSYLAAVMMAAVAGLVVGGAAFGTASGLASRLTDLSLAVSKMGRGTKASVRVTGNDEIAVLGRALSSLASEMAGQGEQEEGASVDFDPRVRELRDKALPTEGFQAPTGYEADGAISAGSRGGMDYFECASQDRGLVMFLLSAPGNNAAATVAVRMARDELLRALGTGANARKSLAHTNRVLHRSLPRGVCATATVVEVGETTVKIYQAGSRVPVLLCAAGELEDLTAEGLALGLDSGPVFEKGLRSNAIEMSPGMRLVVLNDAGNRNEDLVAAIQQHSAKHTAAFMNMVLGEIESAAGEGGLREDVVVLTVKRS